MPELASSLHACAFSVLWVVVQKEWRRTDTFPVNACCHTTPEHHRDSQGSFSCTAIHSEVTKWQRGDVCIGSKNRLFWVFDLIEIWRHWERDTVRLINILVWVFLQSCVKDFRAQEWKEYERWKQEKQGHTVMYFGKSHLPHNSRGEGGVEGKFP